MEQSTFGREMDTLLSVLSIFLQPAEEDCEEWKSHVWWHTEEHNLYVFLLHQGEDRVNNVYFISVELGGS